MKTLRVLIQLVNSPLKQVLMHYQPASEGDDWLTRECRRMAADGVWVKVGFGPDDPPEGCYVMNQLPGPGRAWIPGHQIRAIITEGIE